ncbi:MAG: UDP-3-O-(3-hydroxymyristoyl)glucosamine N-acyltransferase [Deltaproteobacteria bacterium]|nr:UDP-3-O-(3-hydroxymyristoyl)glucosamine N-acyltransferase [Deltaproteobacteria bacterium]
MRLEALARALGVRLLGDGDLEVTRVRAVDDAGDGELGFAAAPEELRTAHTTKAAALLVPEGWAAEHAHEAPCAVLAAEHPARALAAAIDALYPAPAAPRGVDPRAVVHAGARLGRDVAVGPGAVVGRAVLGDGVIIGPLAYVADGVVIGARSRVGPGALVLEGVQVGADALIGPGAVLGDEGFVFAPLDDDARRANVPVRHVGGVVLEDGVAVGANTCVDRGALRDTHVGAHARIDNLVQLGHDVQVGADAVLVAQVGVAGWSTIGAGAVLAGQAGVKERTRVGERARVGGQAGVVHDVADGAAVAGTPTMPHLAWLKAMVRLQGLDALERRVRALEQRLGAPLERRP